MDKLIEKKMKQGGKGGNEVDLFGEQTQEEKQNVQKIKDDDDEDADYIVDSNVIDTKHVNVTKEKITDAQNIWMEEDDAVVYDQEEKTEDEKPKKVGWGDNIKVSSHNAPRESDFYFPGLGDEKAEVNRPYEKKANNTLKSTGLVAQGDNKNFFSSQKVVDSRFGEKSEPMKFKSSGNSKMNKFLQSDENPVKETLIIDDNTKHQFSGKMKLNTEKTEADEQREKFLEQLKNLEEMKQEQQVIDEQVKEKTEPKFEEEKPRFQNSKGGYQNKFLRNENEENLNVNQNTKSNSENDGVRKFTNTKKKSNTTLAPTQDPNVPTASKNSGISTKVTMKTWDE